jgi:hypothetical protein
MAQLILTWRGHVLLGHHNGGEFEGRWTGFIEEVGVVGYDKVRENPYTLS